MIVEAYASATSVYSGETITFHAKSAVRRVHFDIEIYRKGQQDQLLHAGQGRVGKALTPPNAYEVGCKWPTVYSLTIPADWRSGAYVARFKVGGNVIARASFVVKASPGAESAILIEIPVTTLQAYNGWGGRSFYYLPGVVFNPKITFDRPGGWDADGWESFIKWVETHAPSVDYSTSIDLHADQALLNRYKLLVSIWHDEYWSKEMRDNVEMFVDNGGNVCFFSANTCWWQIRFENNNRTMVCFKANRMGPNPDNAPHVADPEAGTPAEVTGYWFLDPPGRPEESLTGVSSRFAALSGQARPEGFTVRGSQHWVFAETGLSDGDQFGNGLNIVGYECDGVDMAGHMQVLYWENWGDHAELDGWHDPDDLQLVGDFMGYDHDQVLFINRDPGRTGGRVLIADFSQGPPVRGLYWENWGDHAELDGWHDPEDLQLVGDFMGVGYDQVLFIHRTGGGNRVLIADFRQGPPIRPYYLEAWGQYAELNGWHDPEDLQLVGDFMGVGHDQVLFINRTASGNRVLIADFSFGPPVRPWYLEAWGQGSWLDGSDDPVDIRLVGDFLGNGNDQVLFINRGNGTGRVMIVDFSKGTADVRYRENWGDDSLLDGWQDTYDLQLPGNFRGKAYDQVLFINRTGGGGRILVASFNRQRADVHYWEDWGDSELLNGWHDPEDIALAGDFMKKGYDQVLFINRTGGGGRVMLASPHKVIDSPPTIKNPAQSNFEVLATADLWHSDWDSYDRLFPVGTATMGIFTRNPVFANQHKSKVFTCGTTDWISGLRDQSEWNKVCQITVNLLKLLGA